MTFFRKFSRKKHIREAQMGLPPEEASRINHRATGFSTGMAFDYIGKAMMEPGKVIRIEDHHFTPQAHQMLFETTARLIDHLGLQGFTCNKRTKTITYSVDW